MLSDTFKSLKNMYIYNLQARPVQLTVTIEIHLSLTGLGQNKIFLLPFCLTLGF